MSRPEDFDRVGELLGDACDAAAVPPDSSTSASTPTSAKPRAGTHRDGRGRIGRPQKTPRDLARAIAEAWTEVVGADVAENATPVRLTRGSLVVSTSSSVWADTLRYMSIDLSAKLNERLGQEAVSDIIFRHAGWEERSQPRTTSTGERTEDRQLTAEEELAVAEIDEYDLPPGLRERAARAMRRSLERGRRPPVR